MHIADVSHFIRPYTALDAEAAARSTTVYLVNKRIDMVNINSYPYIFRINLYNISRYLTS